MLVGRRHSGGVALQTMCLSNPDLRFIRSYLCQTIHEENQLVLTTVYRPPDKPIGAFLSDFQTFPEEMLEYQGDILICGEFNIHLRSPNNT